MPVRSRASLTPRSAKERRKLKRKLATRAFRARKARLRLPLENVDLPPEDTSDEEQQSDSDVDTDVDEQGSFGERSTSPEIPPQVEDPLPVEDIVQEVEGEDLMDVQEHEHGLGDGDEQGGGREGSASPVIPAQEENEDIFENVQNEDVDWSDVDTVIIGDPEQPDNELDGSDVDLSVDGNVNEIGNISDGSSSSQDSSTSSSEDEEDDMESRVRRAQVDVQGLTDDEIVDYLGCKLAAVKAKSGISDASIDAILQVLFPLAKDIDRLLEAKVLRTSFKNQLKRRAMKKMPKIECVTYTEVTEADGSTRVIARDSMGSIPQHILQPDPASNQRLLRKEARIRLSDLIEFHYERHRRKRRRNGGNEHGNNIPPVTQLSLSVDGVEESRSGATTFIIISVRFQCPCIYTLQVINRLIGVRESKPTLQELLRYVLKIMLSRLISMSLLLKVRS